MYEGELVAAAAASSAAATATASAATTAAAGAPAPTTAAAAAPTPTTAAAGAPTPTLEVGVADDETAAHQALDVVDLGALHHRGALRVHQDLDRLGVYDEVAFFWLLLDAEHVLKTSMGTGYHHHAQEGARLVLLAEDLF